MKEPWDHSPPWRLITALAGLLLFAVLAVSDPGRAAVPAWQAGVFLLAACAIARKLWFGFPFRFSPAILPLAGIVVWACVQLTAGTTVYRFETVSALLGWGANLAIFWVASEMFGSSESRRGMRRAMVYFGLVLAVVSTTQMYTSRGKIFWIFQTRYTDLVLGPFVNRDHYAAMIELLIPVTLCEAFRDRRKTTAFCAIAAAMFASVIAGASRAGAALVSAELLVLLFPLFARAGSDRGRQLRPALVKIAGLALLFTSVVGWGLLWERVRDPDPLAYRREILTSSLAMARERPWTGFGLGTFETAYPAFAVFDPGLAVIHAHNDWAQWAAEGGLPLVVLLGCLAAWAARRATRAPWAIGIVAVLLHGLIDFPMQKPAIAAVVFLLLGMLAARTRRGVTFTPRLPPSHVS